MPFPNGLFKTPDFAKVLGFSGGKFAPFQQAHVLGDKKVVPELKVLFDLLNEDDLGNPLPENDPSRLTVDQQA